MARELHTHEEHCRLLLGFRRAHEAARQAAAVGRIMLEEDRALPASSAPTAEPGDLRGIPVIGSGVGGAIAGTKPGASMALDQWTPSQESEPDGR